MKLCTAPLQLGPVFVTKLKKLKLVIFCGGATSGRTLVEGEPLLFRWY
jgi:hypothetical protein